LVWFLIFSVNSLFRYSCIFVIKSKWLNFLSSKLSFKRYHWSLFMKRWDRNERLLYINLGISTFALSFRTNSWLNIFEIGSNQSSLIVLKFIWQMSMEVMVTFCFSLNLNCIICWFMIIIWIFRINVFPVWTDQFSLIIFQIIRKDTVIFWWFWSIVYFFNLVFLMIIIWVLWINISPVRANQFVIIVF